MKSRVLSFCRHFSLNDVLVGGGFCCIVAGIWFIYPPVALVTFGIGLFAAGVLLTKAGK